MSGRVLAWVGGTLVIMAVAGIAAYLGVAGLSSASELAGIVSGFVGLAGLGVAVYGVVQAHNDAMASDSRGRSGEQSVTNTTARSVTQVKGVTGKVRIGGSSSTVSPASPASPPTRTSAGPPPMPPGTALASGQMVADSNIGGDVTQVDGVSGAVDIDR
jgi:membrane protein implicated in regulation of membrane protease activity